MNYPPTSDFHFKNFFENSYTVAARPNIFITSTSADHYILPIPVNYCCPEAVAYIDVSAVSAVPPTTLPPTPELCCVGVPPIIVQCNDNAVVPALGAPPPLRKRCSLLSFCQDSTTRNPQRAWGQQQNTIFLLFRSP